MQKYSVASNMLQLSNISMTKYVMIIKYFYDTVVSQFSGLSPSPQKSRYTKLQQSTK